MRKWQYIEHKYKYRYDPVPYIHNWGGGPMQKMQRVRPILLSLDDPIYKNEFKRGTKKDIPLCWDDKIKDRDIRNWKHQSRCRHQWQRGKKDKW